MVLDRLAADAGVPWQREAKWGAYWAKTESALLVKPMTYMNRSGGPLLAVAQFYKIAPGETLVVLDEMALELGRLRLRLKGSAGGHNGLEDRHRKLRHRRNPAAAHWYRRAAGSRRDRLGPRPLL